MGLLLGLALLAAPLTATAENIGVAPPDVEFGQVLPGDVVTLPLTLTSLGPTPLTIYSVELTDDGGGVFSIDVPPIPPELPGPGTDPETGEEIEAGAVVVDVTFAPTDTVSSVGQITIVSNDREDPVWTVALFGEGFDPSAPPTPREMMDDLLDSIEAAVDAGDLDGVGPAAAARSAHLRAFIMRAQVASMSLDWDLGRPTCNHLAWLAARSDGERRPCDMIQGPAADEINAQIEALLDALGCR